RGCARRDGPLVGSDPMLDLRPVAPGDAPAVHQFLSDPEVAKWLRPKGVSGPFTLAECEAAIPAQVAHWAAHGFGVWLAWEGEDCVGRCLLKHSIVDGRGEVEIGWAVARPRWGRGIGTAMGRHALEAAAEHGVTNVVAFTRTDNRASQCVMEKLGLTYERDFTHAGLPHVLYRAIRERGAHA
ncbi:MAG: GNAT family N-acetyltransferase, partial [Solirubrobacteraceae bacterium]